MQLYSQTLTGRADLEYRVASFYQHLYPSIATPAVLARLDMAADRGDRVVAEIRALELALGEEVEVDQAPVRESLAS